MSTPSFKTELFINNQYVPSKSGQRWTIHNPYDDSVITEDVPCAGEEDINAAVAAARSAYKTTWGRLPGGERAKIMLKFADLLESSLPQLMKLESLAMGQPISLGLALGKMLPPVFRYYAGYCDKIGGEMFPEDGDGQYKLVRYEPLGVCAGIAAWNATLVFFCHKIAPAVAAGNTFIFKPSEKSPLATLELGDLIVQAGFPAGTINLVTGAGPTGALLAGHMDVQKISFTGSVEAGRKVQLAATSSNMKRVTLELGGKSPSIIFEDSDLENALLHSSRSFLLNSGQLCVAASRLLVQESIAEDFSRKLQARFETFAHTAGDPASEQTFLGPLADKAQTESVLAFFAQGKKDGVVFLAGGQKHDKGGNFIHPTIMTNGPLHSSTWTREIFGPALSIRTFRTEEEAIQLANDTDYGLSACVFTSDIARALRVSGLVEAGTVAINSNYLPGYAVPFGGWKQSGNGGREAGLPGLMSYLEAKSIVINMGVGPR